MSYYETIERILKCYKRPVTILDLCPRQETLRALQRCGQSVYVMLTADKDASLLDFCTKNHFSKVILLNRKPLLQELERLGECEHFDIVLAHHCASNYEDNEERAFEAILTLGDYIFINTDNQTSHLSKELLTQHNGKLVSSTDNTNIFMFTVRKKNLKRKRWDYHSTSAPGEYTIDSTFSTKKLIKEKVGFSQCISTWHPGINLLTFKKLNGIYPTKKTIREHLEPLKNIQHNDMKIFNLIIQGTTIQPIDCNEAGRNFNKKIQLELIKNCFRRGALEDYDRDHQEEIAWLYEEFDA